MSQAQSSRIPRELSVNIPYLARTEYARIPLRKDVLLIVYGALTEQAVDSLLQKIGNNIAGFLFFVDPESKEEIPYLRDLRQDLLSRYPAADLVTIMDPGNKSAEVAAIGTVLKIGTTDLVETVHQFDVKSTYRILRKLLLRSASYRSVI